MKKNFIFSIIVVLILLFNCSIVQAVPEDTSDDNTTPLEIFAITDEPDSDENVDELESNISNTDVEATDINTPNLGASVTATALKNSLDFSKATFILSYINNNALLEIKNVTQQSNTYSYQCIITNDIGKSMTTSLSYDSTNKIYTAGYIEDIAEFSSNIYITISHTDDSNTEVIDVNKKSVDRGTLPKYTDVFKTTLMTSNSNQIALTTPWSSKTTRKMNVKVGKVQDTKILNKIKNKSSDAFSSLESYAKSDSSPVLSKSVSVSGGVYSESVTTSGSASPLHISSGLVDNSYYYLYVTVDDDGGKYVPVSGITLSITKVESNGNYLMNFYGSDNFNWIDFDNDDSVTEKTIVDTTTSPKSIPQTGESMIIISTIIMVITLAVVSAKGYKKYFGV